MIEIAFALAAVTAEPRARMVAPPPPPPVTTIQVPVKCFAAAAVGDMLVRHGAKEVVVGWADGRAVRIYLAPNGEGIVTVEVKAGMICVPIAGPGFRVTP